MGPGVPMGPGGPMGNSGVQMNTGNVGMGPRHLGPQAMEQQKLIQQHILRAQHQAMQQHIVRPPPPDYKASAGMMQGMQQRYTGTAGAPPTMRRMPHQPMPPSGNSQLFPYQLQSFQLNIL